MTAREEAKAQEMAESSMLAERGRRAQRFLESEFWILDLEPALAKLQHEAKMQIGWTPALEVAIEKYAMTSAFYSAVDQTVYDMVRKINVMISAGKEAEAYLEKQEENTK